MPKSLPLNSKINGPSAGSEPKVLFLNHNKTQCGVYEFGSNIGRALRKSPLSFVYCECASESELNDAIRKENPVLIIYNYHPATMPWLTADITRTIACPQVGIMHEVTQQLADAADNSLFNFHIAHDPTLLLKNPIVFKAGRLVPPYQNEYPLPSTLTIGSFGFGTGGKGFEKIVELVQKEFDEAIVRFNIPFATFGDTDGKNARLIAEGCRQMLVKPKIELRISHDYLAPDQVLDFLAQNTINVFLYEEQGIQRGVSSATDLALAAKRPIGVSHNSMFRHILNSNPSICLADASIKTIIENGTAPLEKYYREWSEETLCWEYERIAGDVLSRVTIPQIHTDSRLKRTLRRAKRFIKRRLGYVQDGPHTWISDSAIISPYFVNPGNAAYICAAIPSDRPLNNILDDKARKLYQGTIEQMFDQLPVLMQRKIPEANVQQAFVLDTVYKTISNIENPKILCVGSFEDTASEFLKILGFEVEEVDPMLNYDLETFVTKPTTRENSYDVIFSTSVIEHVEKDDEFLMLISDLLKPGGIAVLTCDFCDTYKVGDPKPAVDYRFYTQKDIKERLLSKIIDCSLVDEPHWDCPNPDFNYGGFNYTFGTIVLRKH